jgi:uncharacterized iron-regulated membrane protein
MSAPYQEYPTRKSGRTVTIVIFMAVALVVSVFYGVKWYQASHAITVVAKSSAGNPLPPPHYTPAPAPNPNEGESVPPGDMDQDYVPVPKTAPKPEMESPDAQAAQRYAKMLKLAKATTATQKEQFAVLYACANYFYDPDYAAALNAFDKLPGNSKLADKFSKAIAATCPETVLAYDELSRQGGNSYPTPVPKNNPKPMKPYAPPPSNPGTGTPAPDAI